MKLFKLQYLLREQASSSLAGFYTDPLSRKPSEQGENYSHIAPGRNRTQATLLGGERFDHCTIPALQIVFYIMQSN